MKDMRFKKIRRTLTALVMVSILTFSSIIPVVAGVDEKIGILVIAHGTDEEDNFAGWVNSTSSLANQARLKLTYWSDPVIGLAGIQAAFIHHNETLHPEFTLRPFVESVTGPVVVPLMVSRGYFTESKIPKLLKNLTFAYDGRTLTPHPNVGGWIEMSAAKESTDLTLHIYDDGNLLDSSWTRRSSILL